MQLYRRDREEKSKSNVRTKYSVVNLAYSGLIFLLVGISPVWKLESNNSKALSISKMLQNQLPHPLAFIILLAEILLINI